MTDQQARQILLRHRPGSPDAGEPDIAEALALARRLPGLQAWFESHCLAQTAISLRLKQIRVPAGLKEQILSERKAQTGFWPRKPGTLAATAALLTIIAVLTVPQLLKQKADLPDDESLGFYRRQMVSTVLRMYGMDLETNSLTAVRSYLAEQKLDVTWTLPKGIEKTTVTGCGVLGWRDRKVSMICFRSGNPLPPGQQTDLFLFVVERDSVPQAPTTTTPEIAQVNRLMTATWSAGDKTYVLAADGDEAFLRRFL